MKELPCLEEIYDFETEQLEQILIEVDQALINGANGQQIELPKGFESYDKFERKALKLKEHLELEIDERKQVDDVISFFISKTASGVDLLNDDQFYQPMLNKQNQIQNNDPNINQIMLRQQQQQLQQQQQYLNQKNLSQLSQPINPYLQQSDTQSTSNKQSTDLESDETQSKMMFANRSNAAKNKKDMQAFMREQLQKTKISSEATGVIQHQTQKHFIGGKSKKSTSQKEDVSDTKSTFSNIEKQSIYKPTLKKKESTTNTTTSSNKPPKKEAKKPAERQSITRQSSGVKEHKRSESRGAITKEKPIAEKQKIQNKTQQNIYKPNTVINQQRGNSKPPIANKSSQSKQQQSQLSETQRDEVDKWEESDLLSSKDDDITMNKEEIESKYSDHDDAEEQMNEYKQNISEVDDQLSHVQVQINDVTNNQHKSRKNSTEADNYQQQQQEEKINLIEKIVVLDQEQYENEEEKGDYGNEEEDNDDDFYQPIENVKPSNNSEIIQPKQSLETSETSQIESSVDRSSNNKLEIQIDNQQQKQNLQLDTLLAAESTKSKRIGGRVQIYVDEAAISAQQTPKMIQLDINEYEKKQKEIEKQLEILEKQDLDMKQKQPSKRMELIQMITNQDDNKKKLEQEERLKQIREDMQKEKQQKAVQETPVKNEKVQEQETTIKKEILQQQQTEEKKSTKGKKSQSKQQQNLVTSIPRQQFESDQVIDYSSHYKTFYDIFVGQYLDPKQFDLQYTIRDTRNMYASFVNIMDNNALSMKKKFQFEQAPTEKSAQDYYSVVPNFFTLTGKSVNELELEFKNKNNELMHQAFAIANMKDRFQQNKQKDINDIVKEMSEKAVGGASSLVDVDRESSLFYRVVKNRTEVYDIISRAFSRKKRWNELPHGLDLRNSWNLLWTWSKIKIDISKLLVWQKCNHFSGAKNVSRKDFLKRNMERAMKMSTKAAQVFNICPITFILPKEYVGFLECFSEFEDKEGKFNYWIMKPAAKSRGRGISLVNDLSQITYGEPIVVQRYLKTPLLLNGYKFDLRIYAVVTSVNPLEVFLYKDGFGRFSTIPFSLDPTDKNNKYIHLTNVSIQKYNVNNAEMDNSDQLYGGTKISIPTLKKRFNQATGQSWDDVIWPQIRDVIVKSLVACQNDIQYNPCSFELFGYDIMIDTDYKCWLIEINSSPSLARDTLLDDMIKQRLVDDIIDLVDPVDFDRKRMFEVLERRINEDFKQSTTTNQYSKRLMNRDLTYILNGHVPRKYGEMPKLMGNFERLAPSPASEQYLKLIGGQKMYGSMMKIAQDKQ